jgi:hypothetical protein
VPAHISNLIRGAAYHIDANHTDQGHTIQHVKAMSLSTDGIAVPRLSERRDTRRRGSHRSKASFCKAVARFHGAVQHRAQLLVGLDVADLAAVGTFATGAGGFGGCYRLRVWRSWCPVCAVFDEDAFLLVAGESTVFVLLESCEFFRDSRGWC